ncbi:DUF1254 domain-containing protein [Burkholderia sp. Ac-20379]|uniref:DUF1254 domain-containing protein n=1 Tax=Burkholderia sp. Ac-20379 TaxID=2703900 RepID=UPI00197F9E8C|nr:DUF1214 domain-containing protein [Burkholderia sp. Ac-20379]MBN3725345.1 DUF1254 domain-containing protein [Burkholderia sp. Ac-20379]
MTISRQIFAARLGAGAAAVLVLLAGCASPQQPDVVARKTGWMRSEVADSYIYAYPLVMMDVAREAATSGDAGATPYNTLRYDAAPPAPGAIDPPLPGVDTLAASGWLDVGAEPAIVSVPDLRGRYLDVRVLDMWINVAWSSGADAAARGQTIAFVGPDFHGTLPANVRRVDLPSQYAWIGVQVRTGGGRDLADARRRLHAVRVTPLSAFAARPSRAEAKAAKDAGQRSEKRADTPADAATAATAADRVAALDAKAFFSRFAAALHDNPAPQADPHVEQVLGEIGLQPGTPVDWNGERLEAAARGVDDARARLIAPPSNVLSADGWHWLGADAGHYGQDYALRAYAAATGFGTGTRDDETVAVVAADNDGNTLNGANRYVLHFGPRDLPPVRAFWSLTPYTAEGALPDVGKARRAIGGYDRLQRNRDGSVDIVVSTASPGRAHAANWLPAPRADFRLALRLYAPKPEATDGTWQPPAVIKR